MTTGTTKFITCPSCGRECQANPQGHVNCGWCMAVLAFNSETEKWEVEIPADPVRLEGLKGRPSEPEGMPRTTAEAAQMVGLTEYQKGQQRFLDEQMEQRRRESVLRAQPPAGGVTTTPVTSLTQGLPTEFTPGLDRGPLPQTPEPVAAPVAEVELLTEPESAEAEKPSEFKPIRLHELAKKLGRESKEIATLAVKEGLVASGRGSYMRTLDEGQVNQLLTALGV